MRCLQEEAPALNRGFLFANRSSAVTGERQSGMPNLPTKLGPRFRSSAKADTFIGVA